MSRKYAGTGSGQTPPEIMKEMTRIATVLFDSGWVLRSGAADGADSAFEAGIPKDAGGEIFVPWVSYSDRPGVIVESPGQSEAARIAAALHPAWNKLNAPTKLLMTRSVRQILGASLDDPVEFVLCWTQDDSEATGDAGLVIALASQRGIPVINMKNDGWYARLDAIAHIEERDWQGLTLAERMDAFERDCIKSFGEPTRYPATQPKIRS